MMMTTLAAFCGGFIGAIFGWIARGRLDEHLWRAAARDVGKEYELKRRG
jgi:hypothetical protein